MINFVKKTTKIANYSVIKNEYNFNLNLEYKLFRASFKVDFNL